MRRNLLQIIANKTNKKCRKGMLFALALVTATGLLTVMAPELSLNQPKQLFAAPTNSTDEPDTDGDGWSDNGFGYTVSLNNEVTITGYQGIATALTIPTTIGGKNVVSIADNAFAYKAGITSVTIPGGAKNGTGSGSSSSSSNTGGGIVGVTSIGNRAFFSCPSLTTVTIPTTVTSIGAQAFSDCTALGTINVTAGNQNYLSIDGVLYRYSAPASNTGNAVIANGTYTLLQYPSGKAGTDYVAPATVASRLSGIEAGAFSGAQQLVTVTLPDSLTYIGTSAFYNCIKLETVNVPQHVTSLSTGTFEGCRSLKTVLLPSGLTNIGSTAFKDCVALNAITIPDTVTGIGSQAFYNCQALQEITIPFRVTMLGDYSFAYCTSLKKAIIPVSTTSLGAGTFMGDPNLTIYCHTGSPAATYATNNSIGKVLTCTVKFFSDTGTLVDSQEVVFGESAKAPTMPTRDGYQLKWNCEFTNITSDLSVTATWVRAYTVTFKDTYNDRVFEDAVYAGEDATPPKWTMKGYKLLWNGSYKNIYNSKTVYANWKDVSNGYLITEDTEAPKKEGTKFEKGTVTYKVISDDVQNPKVSYVKNTDALLTTVTIPSTVTIDGVTYKVTQLANGAFKGNENLKKIVIGSQVTKIGKRAFDSCTSLSTIQIKSKKLTGIGKYALKDIKNNAVIYTYSSKQKAYAKLITGSKITTTIRMRKF